jgi:hypothetical protein
MEEKAIRLFPKKSRTPLGAIRFFCLECMGWDRRRRNSDRPTEQVRNCTDELCPLYDFRLGKNPFLKRGAISREHLEALQNGRKKSFQKEKI